MNLSGKSVFALSSFYNIDSDEILIVHDDLNLIPGLAKIKFGGSAGGHNGIKDIQNRLGRKSNFYRLRIGIGRPENKIEIAKFVLSVPSIREKKLIDCTIKKAVYCTKTFFFKGIQQTINCLHAFEKHFHGK